MYALQIMYKYENMTSRPIRYLNLKSLQKTLICSATMKSGDTKQEQRKHGPLQKVEVGDIVK